MKKIIVVFALVIFSCANAQKGSVLVMGSLTYLSNSTTTSLGKSKQDTYHLQPKIGYQFHENWTAGLEANFIKTKQNSFSESKYRDEAYSFGGFVRYSKALNKTFLAYADLAVGYQNRRQVNTLNELNYYHDNDGIYTSLTPSIFIDISNGFGLNFNIGGLKYNAMNYDSSQGLSYKSKAFEVNFGQAISVGISKNF